MNKTHRVLDFKRQLTIMLLRRQNLSLHLSYFSSAGWNEDTEWEAKCGDSTSW